MRSLILAATLALSAPVLAQNTGPAAPAAILANAPAGTRFGLLVVDDQGREVAAIRPDDRFIPASNTKLFTTAAAMALLHDQPADGAMIGLVLGKGRAPNVVIKAAARLTCPPRRNVSPIALAPCWIRLRPRRAWSAMSSPMTVR